MLTSLCISLCGSLLSKPSEEITTEKAPWWLDDNLMMVQTSSGPVGLSKERYLSMQGVIYLIPSIENPGEVQNNMFPTDDRVLTPVSHIPFKWPHQIDTVA